MELSSSRSNSFTLQLKSELFSKVIRRKLITNSKTTEDIVEITLKNAILSHKTQSFHLEMPSGQLKLLQSDAYSKELTLFLSGSHKWVLCFDNLNDFLKWKLAISVSNRPVLQKNQKTCQNCEKSFGLFSKRINCHTCGKELCSACARFLSHLGFLAYMTEERICENCVDTVNRIKSEETESIIQAQDSKSFLRSRPSYENVSVYNSIRGESSGSILKAGCPSSLNTMT